MTIAELMIKFGIDASGTHSGAASVNRDVKSIEDQTNATTGKMSKGFDEAGGHVSKLGGLMQGVTMGMGIGLFNVAEEGFGKLTGVVTDASAAYRDAQTSQAQFSTALVDQHIPAVDATNAAMQSYLDQNEKLGFSADEQRSSLALLVGQTKDLGKAETELTVAEDLSRLKGMSLANASLAIEKAMLGSTGGLKRYGIEVAKGSTATQILADVEKVAGNQADAYAAGPAGRLAAAHEKVHEVMVKLGAITDQVTTAVMPALADVLGNVVDAAGPVLTAIGDAMPGAISTVEGAIGTLTRNLGPVVNFIGKALPGAIRAAQTGFGDMVSAVGSVSAAIAPLVNDVMVPLQQTFADITSNQDALQGALIVLGTIVATVLVPPMILLAASTIATVAPFLLAGAAVAGLLVVLDKTGVLTWLGKNVVPMLGQALQWLQKNVLPPLMDAFSWFTKNVLPPLGDAIGWLVKNVLPALEAGITWIVKNVWPPLEEAFSTFVKVYIAGMSVAIGVLTKTVLPAVVSGFDWITKNVLPPLVSAFDWISKNVLPAISTAFGFITKTVLPDAQAAIKTIGDVAGAIFKAMNDAVQTVVTTVQNLGKAIQDAGKILQNNPIAGLIGGGGDTLKNISGLIPHFAGGTSSAPGGLAWVGERGPELLNLQPGSSITPAGQVGAGSGKTTHVHVTVMGDVRANTPESIAWQVRRTLAFGGAHSS